MKSLFAKGRAILPALSLSLLSLLYCPHIGAAATLAIENENLLARYDLGSHTFSVVEKTSGLGFITDGALEGATGTGRIETVKDPVFGMGKCILINRTDGGSVSLQLYPQAGKSQE